MTDVMEPQTPPQGEPVGVIPQVDPEKEQLKQKTIELEAQKEHWRTKYERDITNVPINTPALPDQDVFSDEGKALVEKYVAPLQQTVENLQDQLALRDLHATYPDLKGLSSEFDEYRKDYPRHKLENVAKLFLTEKGMLEKPRVGLETSTGGPRTAPQQGMTAEDVARLRNTNYPKYREMVKKGQIKV